MAVCALLFVMCCGWCSVALAQAADGGSAPQVRVRIFLEAPLGTAPVAPLSVRIVTSGGVLRLLTSEDEATTQVQVVVDARNTAAELEMTISVDDAEVVSVPSIPISIAANGSVRRLAQFALTAQTTGTAIVAIRVKDGVNVVTETLRVEVAEGIKTMLPPTLALIQPQMNTELRLLRGIAETTTQVQVVIDATDIVAELKMTVSVDNAEVVSVPSIPIPIAANGSVRRSAQFELAAKEAGTATVRITVTDGASMATVVLHVNVIDPIVVRVQQADTVLQLLRGIAETTTQVQVVIDAVDTAAELEMTVSTDEVGAEVVSVPSIPIPIAANGSVRRSAQFELAAKEAGTATVRITVTDGASMATVVLHVNVIDPIVVRVQQADTVLQLLRGIAETTTQVQVVIDAVDTAAELEMTVSTDEAGAEVVSVPSIPIPIAANGSVRRSAQFELTARKVGTATVLIVVTDGASMATVALHVNVIDPIVVRVQPVDTVIQLLSGGAETTTQVQVMIDTVDTSAELEMTVSTDEAGAEVVSVPSIPIPIAANGSVRRSAQFELTARKVGTATVLIAVTDGASMATVALHVNVIGPIVVRVQRADPVMRLMSGVLQLLSSGAEVTTQVQVVIDAVESAVELEMTISTDEAGAEVVSVPSAPILIVASGSVQRSAQFALTVKTTGTATISITVTDGENTDVVALRVRVTDPLQIISPSDGTLFKLVRGDGGTATTQVEVVIAPRYAELPLALELQLEELDSVSTPSVFVSETLFILAAADDGSSRRTARFMLAAEGAGNTTRTLTLVATDSEGNRDTMAVRVAVERVNRLCETCLVPDTVIVPPGTFTMGSPEYERDRELDEGPQHQISIDYALAVGKYEITRAQYEIFIDATGYDPGDDWYDPIFQLNTNFAAQPAVRISWNDAKAYLRWLSQETGQEWRLLSEAEWEYAARAGTTTSYYFGNTINCNKLSANTQARCFILEGTEEVGTYPANEFGLHDVHGNASEWVEDCYHRSYDEAPADGSAWLGECDASGDARILRGGAWPFRHWQVRSANRAWNFANARSTANGFRIARTLSLAGVAAQHAVAIIEPQVATELQLLSNGDEATMQVEVVIYATNTDAALAMTVLVDNAEVVSVPSAPIEIAADSHKTRRSVRFALTAKQAGTARVSIAVTDGVNIATVGLHISVIDPIQIVSPSDDTFFALVDDGTETTAQAKIVIDALDTDAELSMTVSANDAEIVSVPSNPIPIAADGSVRRSAEFVLAAKKTGITSILVAVTDGVSTATVVLRVIVADSPIQIISPSEGTTFTLVRVDGSTASPQVEVVVTHTNTEAPVELNLQLDSVAASSVFISENSFSLAAASDGSNQRTAKFTLAAIEAGNTTLTLVATDNEGNRAAAVARVVVEQIGDCRSCLVPDMVIMSTGTFTMGSPANEPDRDADEGPQRQVNIGYVFSVGKYEVTRGQYRAFVDATGHAAGSDWQNPGFAQSDVHPVVFVSWDDAKEYLSWLSEQTGEEWRLLSEAEWEYAARAGTTTTYAFGNTIDTTQAEFGGSTGTVAVGSYAANAFGLYDMHGNLYEWVEDCWHTNYNGAPVDGSAWLINNCLRDWRIFRGGAWNSEPRHLRSANRGGFGKRNRFSIFGFRVARTLSP